MDGPLVLLTVGVIAFSPLRNLLPGTSAVLVSRVGSIAVLPLANLSGDPAQEFLLR